MNKTKNHLNRAIQMAGSMRALAEVLGVTKGAVFQWTMPGRKVPAEHCPAIERMTGGLVRCEQLRPDVDWGYLRNATPEAVET